MRGKNRVSLSGAWRTRVCHGARACPQRRARGVAAHYEYAPFGAVTSASGPLASINPFRFSSEYHDDTLCLVYYNYRPYNPLEGRWITRDPAGESESVNLVCMLKNNSVNYVDLLGRYLCPCGEAVTAIMAVGAHDAYLAKELANEAIRVSHKVGKREKWSGDHNGKIDAFRHCYWSCRMTASFGEDHAKRIGDIHEVCAENQPMQELAMDLYNNSLGRSIAATEDCEFGCLRLVNEGSLTTSLDGNVEFPPIDPKYTD